MKLTANKIIVICFIVIFIFLSIYTFISAHTKDKICRENGYDFNPHLSMTFMEKGYIECCNQRYNEHIYERTECVGVKR